MAKFSRLLCLRTPRPQSLLGLVSLQTGTELISLALVCNKVTGVYGLLAILTGYQLSLLQLSTYVYSIAVLALLVYLIPHIRRQSPVECLALAWVYLVDTAINGAYTAAFGLEWYFASTAADGADSALASLVMESLGREGDGAARQETATSMLLIAGLTLIRVYFSIVVMAFARQVLQKHMQLMAMESAGVDEDEGPFAADLPDGDGRRGRLGRLMVSVGRGYWLDSTGPRRKPNAAEGTLAGTV